MKGDASMTDNLIEIRDLCVAFSGQTSSIELVGHISLFALSMRISAG